MASDSIEGIYDTLKQCALISKSAGGIGLNIHCIRATGSYIAGVGLLNIISIVYWGVFLKNVIYNHFTSVCILSLMTYVDGNG